MMRDELLAATLYLHLVSRILLFRNFLPKYFGIPGCCILSLGTEILRDPDLFKINIGTIA